MSDLPGRVLSRWRDPKRGKHHLFRGDVGTALCGQVLHIGWEREESARAWADEDCCKRCTRRRDA